MKKHCIAFLSLCLVVLPVAGHIAHAADEVRSLEFPVGGQVSFVDDFGDPRSGGRTHDGIDIMGKKMTPLLSVINGRVSRLNIPEESWGYAIVLRDSDRYTYHYLHVNNDTPGTDDGAGGVEFAYAPGIFEGATVTKGQLVGWMGDSGNAENVGSHLHFEIHQPDGTPINPYQSLLAATHSGRFVPASETAASPSINADKALAVDPTQSVFCVSDWLIKAPSFKAVYYCGADGRRYVFPNDRVFKTWYKDFSTVQTISDAELASIPLGQNVTYKPGTKLVKITTDPKVYAVGRGGVLRWVTTPEIAAGLYGSAWAKNVEDIPDVFFTSYTVGEPITSL